MVSFNSIRKAQTDYDFIKSKTTIWNSSLFKWKTDMLL